MAHRPDARTWHDAVRGGAILGSVFAGHFVILLLVLHPSWRRGAHAAHQHEGEVLRLSFDRLPKLVRPSLAPAAMRLPARTKPARQAIALSIRLPATVMHTTNPPAAPAASLIMAIPLLTGDPRRDYQPGDFQSVLQNAQRTRPADIPGSTAPPSGGIRLQAGSSIKTTVRGLVEGNRCTNAQFQLQNSAHQFTPQMIDRALEREGCGPHIEHAPADAAIDAISRHAIFGY